MNRLINFWHRIDFTYKPYVHPEDTCITSKNCHTFSGFTNYFQKDYWDNKGLFHTDLLPIPYAGNLEAAKIFILLLNPGFTISDYYAERSSIEFKEELIRTIRQSNIDSEFPFIFLNPKFAWHPGSIYWLNKLKDYVLDVKQTMSLSYIEALSQVSKKIAVLELVPYHSTNFSNGSLIKKLESAKQMRLFIERFLMPKVQADESCIVCTRKVKEWNLPGHENVLVYNGLEARAAHLSKNSRAFQLIKRFLI